MSEPARRIVLAIVTIAAIVVFVAAGNWQRERLRAKEAERAALDAAMALPPAPLPRTDDWAAWRYRRVVANGTWRPGAQLLVDNRIVDGRAGFGVVTPLALPDGRVVLVDRGWVAAGAGDARVPEVPAPSGRATVTGRVVIPPARYLELEKAGPQGNVWQNLDPRRIAATTGIAMLPIVVEQSPDASADGLKRSWADPAAGETTHRIYMWQWYAFAALAAGLWLFFTLRRPARKPAPKPASTAAPKHARKPRR
jgi:surfeit locus 1 family protein